MSPLALMKEGEKAEIVARRADIRSPRDQGSCGHHGPCCGRHEHGCCCRQIKRSERDHLCHMGLRPGKHVEMITNSGTGPLVLRLEESRIALGRGMAMKIYVRRSEG